MALPQRCHFTQVSGTTPDPASGAPPAAAGRVPRGPSSHASLQASTLMLGGRDNGVKAELGCPEAQRLRDREEDTPQ